MVLKQLEIGGSRELSLLIFDVYVCSLQSAVFYDGTIIVMCCQEAEPWNRWRGGGGLCLRPHTSEYHARFSFALSTTSSS